MPAAPVLNEVVRLRAFCQDTEQGSINTFAYRANQITLAGATYAEIRNAWDATFSGAMKALIYNGATYRGAGISTYTGTPAPAETYTNANAGAGTAGAVGLPRQAAGLITWYDSFAGPSHRGRTFVPFPSASDNQTLGIPTAGYVTKLAALITAVATFGNVIGAFGTTQMAFGIWHRGRLLPLPVVPPSFTYYATSIARTVWATQRRRGSEGRANTSPV